ncbi:uncharacterized protein LOC119430804 [Nematolebias whitei]|uniref:uncharacterized protein LOC119430804 n=1 Tax=Nematolebias whitei TaxID=451745 RepID=UPI001898DE2F|nr:uncharacterized protein LOC119430804 [Nematolebias whitei]
MEDWRCDVRPLSPETMASEGELRPLSPDTPVPQFICLHTDYIVTVSGSRSVTPESSLSDWEDTGFYLESLVDDYRPDSPQSVESDIEMDRLLSVTALSPDSLSSELEFPMLTDWFTGLRASSPESVALTEGMVLSPFITFGQHCNYYLNYSDNRPTSPLSVTSDEEELDLCLKDMFDENRADAPDSVTFGFEAKISGATIAPSAVGTAAKTLTYADVVRGMTREKPTEPLCSLSSIVLQEPLSSLQLEKISSSTLMEDLLCDVRPLSPETMASEGDLRHLSPDSPVPQFICLHTDYIVTVSGSRSVTPESSLSDWEDTGFYLESLVDDYRPESPQSVESDIEMDKLLSVAALSPDSLSSELEFPLLTDWFTDLRASSPESVALTEGMVLSPFITFGQHCNYYLNFSDNRPTSPLSVTSDEEELDLCLKDMFEENRADSPDSLTSGFEAKISGARITPSAVGTAAKTLTYADVVRGMTREKNQRSLCVA